MKTHRLCGLLAPLMLAPCLALAQAPAAPAAGPNAIAAPAQKTIGTPSSRKHSSSLIVVNARGAKLQGQKLVLEGVSPSATLFTSRPARGVGHMMTPDMVDIWTTGSFAKDPPNATVSVFQKDGSNVSDIVAVLRSPKLEGDKLTFDVQVLEGSIANADGPASIFIDTIWFGVGGSQGFTYLGQSQTTGGETPAVGSRYDTSAYGNAQWANPSPDGPYRSPQRQGGATAPPPPGYYGSGAAPACGKAPLLPCY
ncbi:MAG: hypothetical protein K2Y40_18010 [Reyranella sp.]|nr:hypothetical protein [Reyranella sp.]